MGRDLGSERGKVARKRKPPRRAALVSAEAVTAFGARSRIRQGRGLGLLAPGVAIADLPHRQIAKTGSVSENQSLLDQERVDAVRYLDMIAGY